MRHFRRFGAHGHARGRAAHSERSGGQRRAVCGRGVPRSRPCRNRHLARKHHQRRHRRAEQRQHCHHGREPICAICSRRWRRAPTWQNPYLDHEADNGAISGDAANNQRAIGVSKCCHREWQHLWRSDHHSPPTSRPTTTVPALRSLCYWMPPKFCSPMAVLSFPAARKRPCNCPRRPIAGGCIDNDGQPLAAQPFWHLDHALHPLGTAQIGRCSRSIGPVDLTGDDHARRP